MVIKIHFKQDRYRYVYIFGYWIVKFFFSFYRAIRHPASGYVQGINDLVTPFLVVFLSEHLEGSIDNWCIADLRRETVSNIEADCYWCLSKLLDGMQDHYTFAQPGIQRLVFKLKELVRRIDGMFSLTGNLFSNSLCLWTPLHSTPPHQNLYQNTWRSKGLNFFNLLSDGWIVF